MFAASAMLMRLDEEAILIEEVMLFCPAADKMNDKRAKVTVFACVFLRDVVDWVRRNGSMWKHDHERASPPQREVVSEREQKEWEIPAARPCHIDMKFQHTFIGLQSLGVGEGEAWI